MKTALIEYMRQEAPDENYETPIEAVKVLQDNLLWLGCKRVIWEPCDPSGVSNITKVFQQSGHKVISTGLPGSDFLRMRRPPNGVKCIITNPPYSLKDQFLEKCFSFGIPFCLLLPITALEGVRRGAMFREHGIQVLILDRRVQFIPGKSVYFNTSWFCWSSNNSMLKRDLIFAQLPDLPQTA